MTNKGKIILTSFISIMLVCALGIGTCLIYNQMTADASMSAKSEAIAAGYTIEVGNYMASGYTTTDTGERVYKVYCDDCRGSGYVGVKSLDCEVCSGKGYFWMKGDKVLDCADCHGNGDIVVQKLINHQDCFDCGGDGMVNETVEKSVCTHCTLKSIAINGGGIYVELVQCSICNGTGEIVCPKCNGQKWLEYRSGYQVWEEKHGCTACGGSGCDDVFGRGNRVDGTGYITCDCGGDGKVKGNNVCTYCGGKHYLKKIASYDTCTTCGGDGRMDKIEATPCKTCDGHGWHN